MEYEAFLKEWTGPSSFIEVETSGSTGSPKSIKLEKSFLRESALRTIDFFRLTEKSLLHSCISPDFIGGKMMAVRAALAGALLSWEIPSNSPLIGFSQDKCIDLLAVVPSQMEFIIDRINSLPRINNIIVGGAPISYRLKEKISSSGLNVYETYGMTETASHIALRKVSSEKIPFKTLPGITVALTNSGTLSITFDNGTVVETNDLAEIISPSEFYITGRRDLVINSGGKKINPIDFENSVSHLIPTPFMISSLPDEKWGEKIVMLIQNYGNTDSQEKFKSLLILYLKNELKGWQIPKEIFFVNKIPLTSNGKICRLKGERLLDYLSSLS